MRQAKTTSMALAIVNIFIAPKELLPFLKRLCIDVETTTLATVRATRRRGKFLQSGLCFVIIPNELIELATLHVVHGVAFA
jgi:hypothetical protein